MGFLAFPYRNMTHIWRTCLVFAGLLVGLAAAGWISDVALLDSGILMWPVAALFVIAFGRGFSLGSRRSGITLCIIVAGLVLGLLPDVARPHQTAPATLALYLIVVSIGGYLLVLSVNYLRTPRA